MSSDLKRAVDSPNLYRSTFARMLQSIIDHQYKPQPEDVGAAYRCQTEFVWRFLVGSSFSGYILYALAHRYNFPQNIYAKYAWAVFGGLTGGWYVARFAGNQCLAYLMQNNTPLAREVEEIIRQKQPNYYLLKTLPVYPEGERIPSISQLARENPDLLAKYQDPGLHGRSGVLGKQSGRQTTDLDRPRPVLGQQQEQNSGTRGIRDETYDSQVNVIPGLVQFDDSSNQTPQSSDEQGGRRERYVPPPSMYDRRGSGGSIDGFQPQGSVESYSAQGGLVIKEEDTFKDGFGEGDSFDEGRGRGDNVMGEFS
eukprot:TRINITY_DN16589_c0_g1_i13.p1 TRINITY_DN16589_c0_g1~~TRINITY_DN16589_c0_g1_i13.p1  ORF type:complete len:310 (+),score=43.70 TRINITY_DN16589_c0_g1_i13:91-1020(+)